MPHPSCLMGLTHFQAAPVPSAHADALTLPAARDRWNDISATGGELDKFLGRLRNHLDAATLEATLGLMIREYRIAIRKQRELIGLERLGRRDTSSHMNRLDQLEAVAAGLTVARQRLRARRGLARTDETVPLDNTVILLRRSIR